MSCSHRDPQWILQPACLLKDPFSIAMQVCLSTSAADYAVNKPAGTYKKVYRHLIEQADLAVEVCMDPLHVPGRLLSTL